VGKPATKYTTDRLKTSREGVIDTVRLDGSNALTAYSAIGETGWTYVVSMPSSALQSSMTRAVGFIMLVTLLAFCVAVAGALIASRSIARPLRDLAPDVPTVSAQAAQPVDPLGTRADVAFGNRIEIGLGVFATGVEDTRRPSLDDHDLTRCEPCCCRQPEQGPGGGIGTVLAAEHDDPAPTGGRQKMLGLLEAGVGKQAVRGHDMAQPALGEREVWQQGLVSRCLPAAQRDDG